MKYVDHTYHDFSHYIEEGGALTKHKKSHDNFPARLHKMVSGGHDDVITWMPHGRAWKIIDRERLISDVIGNYYSCKKYESFTRQLNGWGFKRLHQKGPDHGCYYHECFLRTLPQLTCLIRRLPSNLGKSSPFPEGEPNFYVISQEYPLPGLDTSSSTAAAQEARTMMMAQQQQQQVGTMSTSSSAVSAFDQGMTVALSRHASAVAATASSRNDMANGYYGGFPGGASSSYLNSNPYAGQSLSQYYGNMVQQAAAQQPQPYNHQQFQQYIDMSRPAIPQNGVPKDMLDMTSQVEANKVTYGSSSALPGAASLMDQSLFNVSSDMKKTLMEQLGRDTSISLPKNPQQVEKGGEKTPSEPIDPYEPIQFSPNSGTKKTIDLGIK